MAKATMRAVDTSAVGDTPSEAVVKSAAEIKFVTDARGRKIGVQKPRALLRYRLLKILGAESAKNEPLLGNAMLAFLVSDINGDKLPPINSERQLEAMIDRLDDDGLAAVVECLATQFGITGTVDAEENIKNS